MNDICKDCLMATLGVGANCPTPNPIYTGCAFRTTEADIKAITWGRMGSLDKRKFKLGFKLLEVDPNGKLHPLFINKDATIRPHTEWKAGAYPTKGFANRPGIHLGKIPSAPWLMNKDGEYASRRGKGWKRRWFIVAYNATVDYTEEALKQPEKCFREVPENGFYTFFEKGRCHWYICSEAIILAELEEPERKEILKGMEFDETKEFQPYKEAFGKRAATLAKKKNNK